MKHREAVLCCEHRGHHAGYARRQSRPHKVSTGEASPTQLAPRHGGKQGNFPTTVASLATGSNWNNWGSGESLAILQIRTEMSRETLLSLSSLRSLRLDFLHVSIETFRAFLSVRFSLFLLSNSKLAFADSRQCASPVILAHCCCVC